MRISCPLILNIQHCQFVQKAKASNYPSAFSESQPLESQVHLKIFQTEYVNKGIQHL